MNFRTGAVNRQLRGQLLAWSVSCCVLLVSVPAEAGKADLLREQVEAHLAAGEFGAAAELAATADENSRAALAQQVVLAQIGNGRSGDFVIVPRTERSTQGLSSRGPANSRILQGGTGADFGSLMQLIMRETSGEWSDDGVGEGSMSPFESGIRVDPRGVLARESRQESSGRLAALSRDVRVAALNDEMARASGLRLVSLTRLEREVAQRLAQGQPIVESMRHLAGLSQIQYVFVFPDQGEIVIGGPAEGWKYTGPTQAVGVESGRPTLQLDDLVTVLRTFGPGGQGIFGCSIDPETENLKKVKEFVAASQNRGPLNPGAVKSWTLRIGNLLGLQNITVYGIPADSRAARVLVEADYRMKLIGIGKLDAGSDIPDYFQLLAKNPGLASGSLDALRWWMTMKYEGVLHSEDHNTYEVRGSAVLCRSENQYLADSGERVATGQAEPINQQFAANFTAHYNDLARQDPVFADLQGIFDLALVAALIQRNQLDAKAGWDRGAFAADGEYRTARYAAPRQTESVVNHRVFNGRDVVVQVAGGVRADLAAVLNDSQVVQSSPRLDGVAEAARPANLPEGRWWWDVR